MDDLISRHAAINVIERNRAYIGHNMERAVGAVFIEILNCVGEDIGRLPSIQLATDTNVGTKLSTNLADVGTDCISRQDAIEAVQNRHMMLSKEKVLLINDLEKLPSAEPKRGKWIKDEGQQTLMQNFIERGEVWRVCSVCGAGHMIGHKYAIDKAYHDRHHNFCPNCGAMMEK